MSSTSSTSSAPLNLLSPLLLPEGFLPGLEHVIIGRGKKHSKHSGNLRYGTLVQEEMLAYKNAENKAQKSDVISRLVGRVRLHGNFVREVASKEKGAQRWALVEEHAVRTTTAQHFRDALHSKYRSSKANKKYKRQSRDSSSAESHSLKATAAAVRNQELAAFDLEEQRMAAMDNNNHYGDDDAFNTRCVSPDSSSNSGNSEDRPKKRARVSCVISDTPIMPPMPKLPSLPTATTCTENDAMFTDLFSPSQFNGNNNMNTNTNCNINGNTGMMQMMTMSSHSHYQQDPFEPTPLREDTRRGSLNLMSVFQQNHQQHLNTGGFMDLNSSFGNMEPIDMNTTFNHQFIF